MSWIHQAHGGPATWFRGRPKIQRPDYLAALKALQGPTDEKTGVRDAPGSPVEEGGGTSGPPSCPYCGTNDGPTTRVCRCPPHRLLPGEMDLGDDE